MYYDRDGTPLTMIEWAEKFEKGDDRRIAWTDIEVEGKVVWRVATVWLGLDHRFGENGPPLIFETMVFPAEDMMDEECARYPDEVTARKGHQDMVIEWVARTPDSVAVPR